MSIEVGIPPYRVKLNQIVGHGPGGDRWIWEVTVSFNSKEIKETFLNDGEAKKYFNTINKILTNSQAFIAEDHFYDTIIKAGIAFFFGICFGVGIVLLTKSVFL